MGDLLPGVVGPFLKSGHAVYGKDLHARRTLISVSSGFANFRFGQHMHFD
jgi:hypothetical protein